MASELAVARRKARSEVTVATIGAVKDTVHMALANPMFAGLLALAANQAAYKMGLWNPRPSPDGRFRTWRAQWGVDAQGIHFGDRQWVVSDPEEVAAENATIIGTAIIAATIAYAAKAPLVQPLPVLGVSK